MCLPLHFREDKVQVNEICLIVLESRCLVFSENIWPAQPQGVNGWCLGLCPSVTSIDHSAVCVKSPVD